LLRHRFDSVGHFGRLAQRALDVAQGAAETAFAFMSGSSELPQLVNLSHIEAG